MTSESNTSERSSKLSRSVLVCCAVWSASKSANRYEESDDGTFIIHVNSLRRSRLSR
jgi:hypothetical protein